MRIETEIKTEITKVATEGGSCSDLSENAYQWLYELACASGDMPYGTMKARDGDPDEWMDQWLLPNYDEGPQHLSPDECPSGCGPERPELPGDYVGGKWFSSQDIERADRAMDEEKGN
tara:strand:+ start:38008 stop:38361 length:354 start_codon:yes stop_codon:yes gene_type:complete